MRPSPSKATCVWLTFSAVSANAQLLEPPVLDRPIPYVHIREADVMWARRVWQWIDLREKINLPLYYPLEPANGRKALFDVIRDALLIEGSITAYDDGLGDGDQFLRPLSLVDLQRLLQSVDTVYTEDPDTGDRIQVITASPVQASDVIAYKLKEDWIFDKQRSVLDIRIIGLAPVIADKGPDGEFRGPKTLFWLYYPECRYVLNAAVAQNRENDAARLGFDDLFQKRMFNAVITKASNVYDRSISSHATGIDALLESEAIKEELLNFQLDLWHY